MLTVAPLNKSNHKTKGQMSMLTNDLVRSSFSWPYMAHISNNFGISSKFVSCKRTISRICEQKGCEIHSEIYNKKKNPSLSNVLQSDSLKKEI